MKTVEKTNLSESKKWMFEQQIVVNHRSPRFKQLSERVGVDLIQVGEGVKVVKKLIHG